MYPVTHLLVNALNQEAGPVVPPAVSRSRRRPWFKRARRALGVPRYRHAASAP